MSNLREQIKNLPDTPGVYLFKNKKGDILYIGKATSLRDRVRSYFVNGIEFVRSPLIAKMVSDARDISYEQTDSVLEALILEARLIKEYQPSFNSKEKDNKSFNYVVITKEDFPQVLIVRGRDLDSKLEAKSLKLKTTFGPFPHGSELKEALKIIRKIFPWRDYKCEPNQGKPCFNAQIGLCPGVCTGAISKTDYAKIIKNLILFFEGNKKKIIKNLEQEMKVLARRREFEKAEVVKRKIFALNHIQDVALIKHKEENPVTEFRIESYDIAHMSGVNVVGVMTVLQNGESQKSEYRKFIIKHNPGVDDTGALREMLMRRFNHPEWQFPNLVAVDGGIAQKNTAERVLSELNLIIPVVAVTKDDRHKPERIQGDESLVQKHKQAILLGNAEAHRYAVKFHRQKRDILQT